MKQTREQLRKRGEMLKCRIAIERGPELQADLNEWARDVKEFLKQENVAAFPAIAEDGTAVAVHDLLTTPVLKGMTAAHSASLIVMVMQCARLTL